MYSQWTVLRWSGPKHSVTFIQDSYVKVETDEYCVSVGSMQEVKMYTRACVFSLLLKCMVTRERVKHFMK